uniref:hypothetical protein n=1 Tax=Amycolatopsis sp. CA-096443 TaxID=3239919 RepID=UPI003F4947C0
MTPDPLHGNDFEHLIQQLADLAADQLRADARAAAPEPPELVTPEPPVFASAGEAAAALREEYPGRGDATRRLAAAAGRSRRTARQWLRSAPPGRIAEFIAVVTRLLHDAAVADAEFEHAKAVRRCAEEAERLVAEVEAGIAEAGMVLAAQGLRDYHSAEVGAVDVAYAQTGKKDGNPRRIGRVSINFNPVADFLHDMDIAAEEFQNQVLDDYLVGLSDVLEIPEWNHGITIYHDRR